MNLTLARNGRFEIRDVTEQEEKTALSNGWRMDKKAFCLFTPTPEHLRPYSTALANDVRMELWKHDARIIFSKATTSQGVKIPVPSGLDYLDFQTVGITYAAQRTVTLIGDEPGLGKTIQALGVMNADPKLNNVLIICPAIVKRNWQREIEKWFLRLDSVRIAYNNEPFPSAKIVLINPEILKTFHNEIRARAWDLKIVDECQLFKNGETQRGIELYGNSNVRPIPAGKTLLLSGTPLVNRPIDLWSFVKLGDPKGLGASYEYFAKRYCKMWRAPWGIDVSGAANLGELQNRLRAVFMVRRLKADVLKDLPPKRRQIVVIPATAEIQMLLNEEQRVLDPLKSKAELMIDAAEASLAASNQAGDWDGYKKEAKKLTAKFELDFIKYAEVRKKVAVAKVPYATQYIWVKLNEYNKVVVFAHHHEVIGALYEAFRDKIKTVRITGEQNEEKRQLAMDTFQEDPKCQLALVSITVAVGFHLTAACYACAVELDWRPTVMQQAEDRLHRIGQNQEVIIEHLVFNNSTDARQARQVIEKQDIISQAIGA